VITEEELGAEAGTEPELSEVPRHSRRRRLLGTIGLIIVVMVAGPFFGAAQISILESAIIMAVFAVSTNIVVGYSGLVTFGQSLFYGLGAYTIALGWYHYKLPFWLLFVAAPIVGAIAAVPVGLVALRTRRWFFALVTLAFTQLMYTIVEQQYHIFEGTAGVFGPMVPSVLSGTTGGYLFIAGCATVVLVVLYFVMTSTFGVTLKATRESRRRAASVGVNVFKHQLIGFVIAGAGAGIAGALLAVQTSSAYPDLFSFTTAGNPLIASLIGGSTSFVGPIIGAVVFELGNLEISQVTSQWELVLGVVIVAIVLVAPDGLIGLGAPLKRLAKWRSEEQPPTGVDTPVSAAVDLELDGGAPGARRDS